MFVAVCYAKPQGSYDYTPRQQQSHQQHGSSHGGFQQHGSSHGGFGQQGGGGVHVTKHVYVHAPPEDPAEQFHSQPAPPPPVQKHYKIIFIKAPSNPAQEQFASPQLPLTDEKTIVYVLVKRPDENLNVDSALHNEYKPTKPEVYFIKYKTKGQQQPVTGGSATSSSFRFGGQQQHGGGHHAHHQPPSTKYGTPSTPNQPDNNYGPPELPNLPDNEYGPPHK